MKTRQSLIFRLHDVENQVAWDEFVVLYQPMIRRIAIKMGMQPADVGDVTQEVLLHLTRVVQQWDPKKSSGSFRGWLYRVSRNLMIRWISRQDENDVGSGNSDVKEWLAQQPDPKIVVDDVAGRDFDIEFQREAFAHAIDAVRGNFQSRTWQAFWMTVVENQSISDVSQQIDLRPGAIYVARSRVMSQLRKEVKRMVNEEWASLGQTGFYDLSRSLGSKESDGEKNVC